MQTIHMCDFQPINRTSVAIHWILYPHGGCESFDIP